jgi:vitamin B12 transporter
MKPVISKYLLFIALLLLSREGVKAQSIITGKITNTKKESLNDANIILKSTSVGANADSAGVFSLSTSLKGKQILEISSVGFTTKDINIELHDSIVYVEVSVNEESKMLGDVVVNAGSFEASDKAKGASLTNMDAFTVAGNGGDVAMALRSLPGAQQIGDKEGLFVRGGTSEETKQFIDGALVPNPNYASVPGIPQPARINPFLFKGILFSTGGYSALYGDALSSALILESVDLPDKSSASLNIFPQVIGAGLQQLGKDKKSSYGVNINYGDLQFYDSIIPQIPHYFYGPEFFETNANFRMKTGKTGVLKFYANYSYSNVGLRNADIDSSSLLSSFQTMGKDLYTNLSYRSYLSSRWRIDAVMAYNYNNTEISAKLENQAYKQVFIDTLPYNEKNSTLNIESNFVQERAVLTLTFSHNQAFRIGAENFYSNDNYNSNDTITKLPDNLTAVFTEGDIYLARNLAAKIGVRAEHSSLLGKTVFAPRLSMAYRFDDGGQINVAYGVFYQKPEVIYLVQNEDLGFAQAIHYILNYQKKANNRLLRIEAYYKLYKGLVTIDPATESNGEGYARGVELFFRDKRTFKNIDYWVSYTYLDTKRKYLNYPEQIRPDFSTPHTVTVAIKRFFPDINFGANLSYALATGRPYYDIQTGVNGNPVITDNGTTIIYNNMNLSFDYLFTMFKKRKGKDLSGIGFGINNVLDSKQVYGYYYSYNGLNKVAVAPPAKQSYYIGLFMTFGIDRRDDFINNNL